MYEKQKMGNCSFNLSFAGSGICVFCQNVVAIQLLYENFLCLRTCNHGRDTPDRNALPPLRFRWKTPLPSVLQNLRQM